MHEIGPRDVVEAMLVSQMVLAHVASMDVARRALQVEQSAAGRAAYLRLARKLMALFAMQRDAFNRHRGKGTKQKIVSASICVSGPTPKALRGKRQLAVENAARADGSDDDRVVARYLPRRNATTPQTAEDKRFEMMSIRHSSVAVASWSWLQKSQPRSTWNEAWMAEGKGNYYGN